MGMAWAWHGCAVLCCTGWVVRCCWIMGYGWGMGGFGRRWYDVTRLDSTRHDIASLRGLDACMIQAWAYVDERMNVLLKLCSEVPCKHASIETMNERSLLLISNQPTTQTSCQPARVWQGQAQRTDPSVPDPCSRARRAVKCGAGGEIESV